MPSSHQDIRTEVVRYASTYYAQHASVPSVRAITEKFRRRLTKGGFYKLFRDGMEQLCREAGIPVPADRLKHTARALETRESTTHTDVPLTYAQSTRLVLSEEQSRRIYGMSHLEGGKDPSLLMSELLDRDSVVRRLMEKPQAMPDMVRFFEQAVNRGWQIPWLLDMMTMLWNGGVMRLSAEELGSLADVVVELGKYGFDPKQTIQEAMGVGSMFKAWLQFRLRERSPARPGTSKE